MVTAIRVRGAQRRWSIASSILLALSAALALPAQRALWRVEHDWDQWQEARRFAAWPLCAPRSTMPSSHRTKSRARSRCHK
jgi:hypothetical protein